MERNLDQTGTDKFYQEKWKKIKQTVAEKNKLVSE
jgi:hypothetical protein